MTVTASVALAQDRRLRVPMRTVEFAVFTIFILVLVLPVPYAPLFRYPVALYFLYAFVRDWNRHAPLLRRSAILFAFPAWAMLSVLWAQEPVDALKFALQIGLTMVVCLHAASWLTPRQVIVALFIVSGIAALLSFGPVMGGQSRGIFAHKNPMGAAMNLLWLSGLALALDRRTPAGLRILAVLAAGIGFLLSFSVNSATAMALTLAGGGILLAGFVFVGGGTLLLRERLGLMLLALGAVVAVLSLVAVDLQVNVVDAVLQKMGKSRDLTGRTDLWPYAVDQIAQRPFLGVGPGGFWNYDEDPLVRRIYFEQHKQPWHLFNFHSSVLEIGVHLGLIGLAIAGVATLWALLTLVRGVLLIGGVPFVFFAAVGVLALVRAATESDFLKPFELLHMMLWCGALFALRASMAGARR
jgi:exopolysaccharide production protein ExoQ